MTDKTPGAALLARWLAEHGDYLYRFAFFQLHDAPAAEDLVQDTLIAAWTARKQFAGAASERTWLTAILKNKIVDHFRRTRREAPSEEELSDDARALNDCLAGLSAVQAQAFMLAELHEMSTSELCKVLGLSATNVWVVLHRARMRLRLCLEEGWLRATTGGK